MATLAIETGTGNGQMSRVEAFLLNRESITYTPYYNGKMSYKLAGQDWEQYVIEAFPNLKNQNTSENIFKTVIDLYAENLVPLPDKLRGFSNILMPLLTRGEAPVLVLKDDTVSFPEHFEMMSDGKYTIVCIFTRTLEDMKDNLTFADSSGRTRLFSKPVPDDFSPPDRTGYTFVEETTGNSLFRFALDDKGFGATLAALQDRLNHSILDETVIAEMYARPFWYLLNVDLPPKNPYLAAQGVASEKAMEEQKDVKGAGGRVFTTSSEGPFGELKPPTITDIISYHDSMIDKVPLTTGIPMHYFKPGTGVPPTGVALKVLSKRFNNRIARIRDDIQPTLEALCEVLGVPKDSTEKDKDGNDIKVYWLWNQDDDLLQEALDAHGISLSTMGYPLEYIAEVVTPGIDLDDYMEDEVEEGGLPADGPVDMTAAGQTGTPATPGQVQAYKQNPGQRAKAKA